MRPQKIAISATLRRSLLLLRADACSNRIDEPFTQRRIREPRDRATRRDERDVDSINPVAATHRWHLAEIIDDPNCGVCQRVSCAANLLSDAIER